MVIGVEVHKSPSCWFSTPPGSLPRDLRYYYVCLTNTLVCITNYREERVHSHDPSLYPDFARQD